MDMGHEMTAAQRKRYGDALSSVIFAVIVFLAIMFIGLLALCAVHAQTTAQIDACRPDAARICPNSLTLASARACLVAHRSQVSRACKDAFTAEK
jgi:hypothetical protein